MTVYIIIQDRKTGEVKYARHNFFAEAMRYNYEKFIRYDFKQNRCYKNKSAALARATRLDIESRGRPDDFLLLCDENRHWKREYQMWLIIQTRKEIEEELRSKSKERKDLAKRSQSYWFDNLELSSNYPIWQSTRSVRISAPEPTFRISYEHEDAEGLRERMRNISARFREQPNSVGLRPSYYSWWYTFDENGE